MNRILIVTPILFILLVPSLAQAQAPTPPDVPTLGPVIIKSAGGVDTGILIVSPQNQSYIDYKSYPIKLLFCVKEMVLPYSFGNIGYSLDGGTILGVSKFLNETRIREMGDNVTVWAEVALPRLSEGPHVITAYYGYQFSGINQRYEVFAYSTVNFLVSSKTPTPIPIPTASPTPTIQEFSSWAILLLALIIVSTGLLVYFTKYPKRRN
jgi:hypothetical protein